MKLTHLSLFSGIGGIDLAAQWAGFETVAFVEKDKFCQQVLAKNFPNVPIFEDVKQFSGKAFRGRVKLLSGGFPCQPFSVSSIKRRGAEDDRALWPEMLRVVKECGPAWVIGENVTNLIGMALDDVCQSLEDSGYKTRTFNISAVSVGASHKRARLFIVAYAGGKRRNERKHDDQIRVVNQILGQRPPEPTAIHLDPIEASYVGIPEDLRMDDGIPGGLDEVGARLKALGNAVNPYQIYPIIQTIADIERGY